MSWADLTFQVEFTEIEPLLVSPCLAHIHAQGLEERDRFFRGIVYEVLKLLSCLVFLLPLVCLASRSLGALFLLCKLDIAGVSLGAIGRAHTAHITTAGVGFWVGDCPQFINTLL